MWHGDGSPMFMSTSTLLGYWGCWFGDQVSQWVVSKPPSKHITFWSAKVFERKVCFIGDFSLYVTVIGIWTWNTRAQAVWIIKPWKTNISTKIIIQKFKLVELAFWNSMNSSDSIITY